MSTKQSVMKARLVEKLMLGIVVVCLIVTFLSMVSEITLTPIVGGLVLLVALAGIVGVLIVQKRTDTLLKSALSFVGQQTDETFRELYDHSPTPYVTIATSGIITTANSAAVSLLQSTMGQLSNQQFFSFVVEYTDHSISVLQSKIKSGVTVKDAEVRLQSTTGKDVWALLSVFDGLQPGEHIISLVDITTAKKVDIAKSEFVALATHQLRTPIAAIRWNHELLTQKLSGDAHVALAQYLDKIGRNTLRMIALIDDFLSASQLEMGTYAAKEETVNLEAYYTEILDEFEERIARKSISVSVDQQPPGFSFTSDTRLLHIIVSNLVSNAVKYLPDGGALTLRSVTEGTILRLEVSDNGIGIPAAEQDKLFKRFFRATNARQHQVEGTGLGLYLVRQAVQRLGGTITCQSTENVGTTFTVKLPIGYQSAVTPQLD